MDNRLTRFLLMFLPRPVVVFGYALMPIVIVIIIPYGLGLLFDIQADEVGVFEHVVIWLAGLAMMVIVVVIGTFISDAYRKADEDIPKRKTKGDQ